ncbi:Uncharacterized protein FKW44_006527, partial [Caligus rogercresseyi]
MRTSLSLTLFIILQFSVATRGQRGRSKYRPLKTSFFDPDAGVFRRTPYNPKGSTNESPSSTTPTTWAPQPPRYTNTSIIPRTYDFPSGVMTWSHKRRMSPFFTSSMNLMWTLSKDSMTTPLAATRSGDCQEEKIYFDVEEVRPSEEVDNRLESEVQSINKRPKPLIKSRISKTRITTTSKPSYFLPTIATTAPIRSTTTSTLLLPSQPTSAAIVTTTTTTTTTTEIERSTWRTTTTTERHFRFNKKKTHGLKWPCPIQPMKTQTFGILSLHIHTQKGNGQCSKAAAASIRHSVGDIIQEERYREESHTTPATRTSPIDWNIKKRIRTKLNRNKKRRILTTTTTTTISTTTTSKAFRTFPPPSDESESRNNYLFTTSSDRDHRKTLRQNPDIYGSRSTTTPKPSTKEVTSTYPSYFIEDFRDPIPSPEDLRHAPPFRTYINALDQPKVPNLLDFHPSFQEQNFAPRDNFYVRLQELEHEA